MFESPHSDHQARAWSHFALRAFFLCLSFLPASKTDRNCASHVVAKSALRPFFCLRQERSHPPAPLLLLFRKKSRSHRLTACKRAVFTPIGSLPTFCGCACRRQSFLSHLFNSSVHKNTRIFSLSKCRYEHPYQKNRLVKRFFRFNKAIFIFRWTEMFKECSSMSSNPIFAFF